jgi:ADP-ribose pyrophosphatase YjhB (NUDIX family)
VLACDTVRVDSQVAAIVLRGDAVLLVRRGDVYTLPGGPVGEHETAEQACVRELRERTTLTGEIDEALWVLDDEGTTERYFLLGPVTGMAHSAGDADELVWMDVQKLATIDLRPTLIRDQLFAASEGV